MKSATTAGKDNKQRPDLDPYVEKGYIPLGFFAADMSGDNSVSHALEYYVADNALAQLWARRMMPSCSANARSDINTTTLRKAAPCVLSTPMARS